MISELIAERIRPETETCPGVREAEPCFDPLPAAAPTAPPRGEAGSRSSGWMITEILPHESALRSYLRGTFPSIDVDDVIHDSYLKLLKTKAGGRITSAKGYLFTIARNTARTLVRRQRIYSEAPANEYAWRTVEMGPDAAETANVRLRLDLAVKAIDRLPPCCREILKITLLEGLSPLEIAARLKISENTVYVQFARGVRKCAAYVQTHGGSE